ncbi:HNH endonuclease signature motif containing protein [Vibrio harveyi]|uniref:HNH endonuclease signature motif containing protein n=1 Tax=Vibrio harveyi TaxID=669 RepID=UPI0040694068
MTSKRTYEALVARGIDTNKAQELVSKRLTLSKIKAMTEIELEGLGLPPTLIEAILKEGRPPIPSDTVFTLLHESKRTCCVCRDPSRSVVIHHINQWSESKDHSENNLVVVCLEHHNDAHTTKGLSLSLTKKQLRQHKSNWLKSVQKSDARAVLGLMQVNNSSWDYINHNRMFQLASNSNIDLLSSPYFMAVNDNNMVNSIGLLQDTSKWAVGSKPTFRLYDCGEGTTLYFYTSSILERLLQRLPIFDVTEKWTVTELKTLLSPGKFICLRGAFYYKNISTVNRGRNRMRHGYRRKSKIRVDFQFDAWEATSSTSDSCHLSGRKSSLAILLVKSISKKEGWLNIQCSCLAIGSGFSEESSDVYWTQEDDDFEFAM